MNDTNNKKKWEHFDIAEKDPDETPFHRWMPMAGAGLMVLVLGGAGAWLISKMAGSGAPPPPAVQQISIVMPPPPPPPPPKMEEPEPEAVELETPEPEPMADDTNEPAPGEELGLDADGVAGSDSFGLKARKGGRGLLGDGDPYAWYAGIIQRDLQAVLSNDDGLRGVGNYAVVISLSLGADGSVRESRLLSGTNNPQLDAALRRALSPGVRISREPPDDLPQPIRLRITSRG